MAMPRESSFMPAVKCSSCGIDVQISLMGEHICAGAGAQLSGPDAHSFGDRYNVPPLPEKYGRLPAPVDTGAANGGYMRPGPRTPGIAPRTELANSPNMFRAPARPIEDSRPRTAGSGSSAQPPSARRPGGYGGFGDTAGQGQDGGYLSQSPSQQGGGFLQRAGTIAPGPFDANRRPSLANNAPQDRWGGNSQDASRTLERPGTSHANMSNANGLPSPRLPRKDGYGGFGPPPMPGDSFEPEALNRSETFPRPSFPNDTPLRTPSAPGARPDRSWQKGAFEGGRRPSNGPDTSRPPPPRTSVIRPRTAGKHVGAPLNVAEEFGVGNPYHTPSDSASSGYSTFSGPSQSSSQTSPARSQSRRQRSDDNVESIHPPAGSLRTKDLRIDPTGGAQPPLRTPSPLVESPFAMSPRESPYGSAPQSRRQDDLSPRAYDRPMPSPRLGSSPQRERDYFGAGVHPPQRNNGVPAWMATSPPSPQVYPPTRKGSRDPTASRGDCKACRLPITGKSVSSADGRLTGKYHKACFVCTTCAEPFASAEFYVLNDKPFCEQHYHKLNGSLCGSCGRGIEGQYLEDETLVKYHVGCFRCLDCGQSLSDGYFDVDGKSYCERDAWRRVQQAWNGGAGAAPAEPEPYPPAAAAAPRGGASGRRPPPSAGPGLPGNPAPRPRANGQAMPGGGQGMGRGPYGVAPSSRAGPGSGAGPKLNKRMTRIGMM